MTLYNYAEDKLGLLTLPLILLGLLACMLILELSFRLIRNVVGTNNYREAVKLLESERYETKHAREEALSVWLTQKQAALVRGNGVLLLIGLIAPITGLLGTVVGLIHAFDSIAMSTEGVNPALVAEGLGLAMNTTAAGLMIALPSVLVANLTRLGVDHYIQQLGLTLSEMSLKKFTLTQVSSDQTTERAELHESQDASPVLPSTKVPTT